MSHTELEYQRNKKTPRKNERKGGKKKQQHEAELEAFNLMPKRKKT